MTFQDLILIAKGTPHSYSLSYGIKGVQFTIEKALSEVYYGYPISFSPKNQVILSLIIYPSFILYFLICFIYGLKSSFKEKLEVSDYKSVDAFYVGSSIFLGTFMLGMNFEYRLAFLLFTIPQIAFFLENEKGRNLYFARLLIICILLSVWNTFVNFPFKLPLLQFIHWTLFGLLSYFLAYLIPNWLKLYISSSFFKFMINSK